MVEKKWHFIDFTDQDVSDPYQATVKFMNDFHLTPDQVKITEVFDSVSESNWITIWYFSEKECQIEQM